MRLINPSLGECADRLTILDLKIEFGRARDRDIRHFEEERDLVLKAGAVRLVGANTWTELNPLLDELREVNRTIWNLEATVRKILATATDAELGALVRIITPQNDRRAELVREINALGAPRGESASGSGESSAQEKLYE